MSVRPNSPAARDVAYPLPPYTNARRHEEQGPMIVTEGEGVMVRDDQGNQYIEAMAGLWCTALGFGEQRLVKVASEQLAKLPYYHSFAHKVPEPVIDLAEKLISLRPVMQQAVRDAGLTPRRGFTPDDFLIFDSLLGELAKHAAEMIRNAWEICKPIAWRVSTTG